MKPLTIYLDTQDYINIFNEAEGGANNRVLKEVLRCRDDGVILIGYSFATVLEFITRPDADNRLERVKRGQLIKDICGEHAFPYLSDLANGAKFPNGGHWILSANEKAVSASDFKLQMKSYVKQLAQSASNINRGQRRRLSKWSVFLSEFLKYDPLFGTRREDYGDIPVSNEVIESKLLLRFITGKCTDAEFEKTINRWLSDPAEFSRLYYDYAKNPNAITHFFGPHIDRIEQAMQKMHEVIEAMRVANENILKSRSSLIEAGVDRKSATQATKQIKMPPVDFTPLVEKVEEVVGKGRAGHISHYLERASKATNSFKRSDVMDLIQLCYAYDCDLFRCDKAMASTFSDFAPFRGKLVGRFSELPDKIEALVKFSQ